MLREERNSQRGGKAWVLGAKGHLLKKGCPFSGGAPQIFDLSRRQSRSDQLCLRQSCLPKPPFPLQNCVCANPEPFPSYRRKTTGFPATRFGRIKGVWEARNQRFRGRFATGLAESEIQATHREKGNLFKRFSFCPRKLGNAHKGSDLGWENSLGHPNNSPPGKPSSPGGLLFNSDIVLRYEEDPSLRSG